MLSFKLKQIFIILSLFCLNIQVFFSTINLSTFRPELYQNSVGKSTPFSECKIVNPETGKIQPIGVEGELYVRGYSVSPGYWNDEAKTKEAFDENGW